MALDRLTLRFAYDCKLQRPACPLLQAALGGDPGLCLRFPAEHWLVSPTPHLKLYEATLEQIEELSTLEPVKTEEDPWPC